MLLILIRILFFCLIPAGIFLLVKGVKMLSKSFNGKMLLEISLSQKEGRFFITKEGHYSIWQKGRLYRKTPLDRIRPVIRQEQTGQVLELSRSLMRPANNNGRYGRMELYSFSAAEGTYLLELIEGSSLSGIESLMADLIPIRAANPSEYYIQIRESQPVIYLLLGIPLLILSGGCIIGGLVLGLCAEQLFR